MLARLLYGLAFTVGVPVLLYFWNARLETLVTLPVVQSTPIGIALIIFGISVILEAMRELRTIGGGLPMNAFPPPRHVSRGLYGVITHPIYFGFVVALAGAAVTLGSPAGYWITTPVSALACGALILGYERHDLARRFGADRPRPLLCLPPDTDDRATKGDRLSVLLLVLLPWLVLYESIGHLPVPGAFSVVQPTEAEWPVWVWTEIFYVLVYPFVVLAPLAFRSRSEVRRACIRGWFGIGLGMLAYLVIPAIAPPRPFEGEGLFATLLALERADGLAGRAAFPSFHVFWAWWAARAWSLRGRRVGVFACGLAAASVVSCSTTGMHALVDLIAGTLLAAIVFADRFLWECARRFTERVANSWREWRRGRVRLIVHGFYAAAAATLGTGLAGALLGDGGPPRVAALSMASLVGAGLWGQYWVGSKTLLRPYGYFGSVLGVGVALLALAPFGMEVMPLAAALAVVAPWVQAIGRLRCMVQGCCHGAPAPAEVGIMVNREESRVTRVAHLNGQSIHPTPLYSILANLVVGALLLRLWSVGGEASLILAGYLILAGITRFVEESYRGEPQTPIVAGLRLYQWFSVISVALGLALTWLPSTPVVPAAANFSLEAWAWAAAVGAFHLFAMGVDFPDSARRFSRLV